MLLGKDKLLKEIVDLFFMIDGLRVNLNELTTINKKRIIRTLNRLLRKMIAFQRLFAHSIGDDARFWRFDASSEGEKYLVKPYRIQHFAFEGYPYVVLNKKFIERFLSFVKHVESLGKEVEVIRGFIPFARWGAFSRTYRLVETHCRGKAVDVNIKGLTPSRAMDFIESNCLDIELPFIYVELKDGVHIQQAPNYTHRRIWRLSEHNFYPCSTPNPNPFL